MDSMVMKNLFNGVYDNRKVLVTGHTGFKGSWLALWLKSMNGIVKGYSLPPETSPAHWSLLDLKIESELSDIRMADHLNKTVSDFIKDLRLNKDWADVFKSNIPKGFQTQGKQTTGKAPLLPKNPSYQDIVNYREKYGEEALRKAQMTERI